ncbi:hypothetical protein OIU84_012485 [Salix udensis]|uniref:Late embryogenesis abundant protein LEA-2 subgroup domain-containing protein n=1 Tax=Salix udensis TaxID=889485 RepID=A0AAD6JG55_9ROSI|nr:hypothetical protein OIU84_012485 [Salix udensis]
MKPPLQTPPGYRDPNLPAKSAPRPLPTKAMLPPSFQPRKRRSRHCRLCFCCLILLIMVAILLLMIAGGLFYLWFDPKLPVFHLQSLKLSALNITKKPDGTFLSAKMVARIEGQQNTTSLKIETSVNNELIEDGIGSKILDQFMSKKLKVNLDVKTSIGIGAEGVKTGLLGVEVLCGGVTLKETITEMPRCIISTLKW